MAGKWPDAPGRKMNLHEDGTIILKGTAHGGSPDVVTGVLTDETGTTDHQQLLDHERRVAGAWIAGSATRGVVYIFPELRDIDGTYINASGHDSAALLHSADTTNGLDGTWTLQSSTYATITTTGEPIPEYRNGIYTWAQSARRAVQFWGTQSGLGSGNLYNVEVFGEIAAGETPDRILILDDDTGLEFGIPMDWGDMPRGAARDKLMRLQNNSGALTASTVDVGRGRVSTIEDDATSWWTFDNGAGFGTSFSVTSIAAGASDTFTARLIIPSAAVPSVQEIYMDVSVGSWA